MSFFDFRTPTEKFDAALIDLYDLQYHEGMNLLELKEIGRTSGFGSKKSTTRSASYKLILKLDRKDRDLPSWNNKEVESVQIDVEHQDDVASRAFNFEENERFFKDDKDLDDARTKVTSMIRRILLSEDMYDIEYNRHIIDVYCFFYVVFDDEIETYNMLMKFLRDFYGILLLNRQTYKTNYHVSILKNVLRQVDSSLLAFLENNFDNFEFFDDYLLKLPGKTLEQMMRRFDFVVSTDFNVAYYILAVKLRKHKEMIMDNTMDLVYSMNHALDEAEDVELWEVAWNEFKNHNGDKTTESMMPFRKQDDVSIKYNFY
ncbi:hypothetical protein MHBO_001946 [Bonamia ostreae]|uniref:Uncharacterized protein n=1 Tax=Bonamia ostreae TaxID=126728 RepID=A0ABV2AKT7_9EUKA